MNISAINNGYYFNITTNIIMCNGDIQYLFSRVLLYSNDSNKRWFMIKYSHKILIKCTLIINKLIKYI